MTGWVAPIPDDDARELVRGAERAMGGGDAARARALLRRALAIDPRRPGPWLGLAAACRALSDPDGAMEAVEGALRIEPRNFIALLTRASLIERRGEAKRAAAAYGVALTQAPPDRALDAATLRAVRRARELNARHAVELEAFVRARIAERRAQCRPDAARRIDAFVETTLGRRRRYRQEPSDYFYPGLPAMEFQDRDEFPWLADLERATAVIRGELMDALRAGAEHFVPYIARPDHAPLDQWAALNRSPRWSAYHLIDHGSPVAEARRRCPRTLEALAPLPQPVVRNRSPVAMFSLLRPRTRIPPHTGVANTRLVVHLPLVVPPGCGFRVGAETREWREGEAWVFDDTIEHEAWNESDRPRAVLVCDIWSPRLADDERDLIAEAMAAMDEFNAVEPNAGL